MHLYPVIMRFIISIVKEASHFIIVWEWSEKTPGVVWEWPENGLGMAWEWSGNGLRMVWEWPENGLGMAWEWSGNGLRMVWEQAGNGIGMAPSQALTSSTNHTIPCLCNWTSTWSSNLSQCCPAVYEIHTRSTAQSLYCLATCTVSVLLSNMCTSHIPC